VHRRYAESLLLAAHFSEFVGPDSVTVADVGSGAGFPGVPVAVYRPDWRVSLIESHKQKSVFLAEAARQLPNVSVLASRRGFDRKVERGR
jgi:16S rRNA (guanine527-N7)-methyltransferase